MSTIGDIFATYRGPRRVMERRLARANEATALMTLMAACLLIFVSRWPPLKRAEYFDPAMDFDAQIGATLLSLVFFTPLVFYGLSGLIWLGFRLAGRNVSGLSIRTTLFWSLLAASPLWLAWGLAQGLLGEAGVTQFFGVFLLAAFVFFGISGMVAASRTRVSE